MKPTLSVAIICKNEEKNITTCINSIKAIADEIIVVDTGSTDDSCRIATSLGAKLFHHKWNNDFSAAKNKALAHCTKDWVLVLDCDEIFSPSSYSEIKPLLTNSKLEGYYLKLINYIGNTPINENWSLRLFRNNPNYRFESKLHEQIFYSITKFSGDHCLGNSTLEISHYGYDHNKVDMMKKIKRNISVLETYEEKERDSFYFYSLANEYSKLGNEPKALELYLMALNDTSKDYGFYPYLSVNLINLLIKSNDLNKALEISNFFEAKLPNFRDLYFLKTICYYELGKYTQSYSTLIKYKSMDKHNSEYPSFNFENDNDIDALLTSLNTLKINSPSNLCSTLILCENSPNNLPSIDAIAKQFNDLSEDIFILTDIDNYHSTYTNNIFNSKDFSFEEILNRIKATCNCKWILVLNSNFVFEKFHIEFIIQLMLTSTESQIPLFTPDDYIINANSILFT